MESERVGMPMTFGVLRPVVMLPAGAPPLESRRPPVRPLHELAHVRRGDVATHLMARTALGAVSVESAGLVCLGASFLKERERATDDLVLDAGDRASEYAGHLLEVARTLQPHHGDGLGRNRDGAAVGIGRPPGRDPGLGRQLRPLGRRAQAFVSRGVAIAIAAPSAAVRAQDPGSLPTGTPPVRAANAQKQP